MDAGDSATNEEGSARTGGSISDYREPATPDELRDRAINYAGALAEVFDLGIDLDAVEWVVDDTDRRKRLAAQTVYPRVEDATIGIPLDWDEVEQELEIRVELTWNAYRSLGWVEYTQTIRHELVHVEQVTQYGTTGHNPRFYDRAVEFDTSRHCKSWAEPKYRLLCPDCDLGLDRYRESKWVRLAREGDAHCGSCNTPLELEINEE